MPRKSGHHFYSSIFCNLFLLIKATIIHSDKSDVGLDKYDVVFIPVTIKFKNNNIKKHDFYVAQQYV